MKTVIESFYEQTHKTEKNYGAGKYDLAPLLGNRTVKSWLRQRRKGEVSVLDVGCGKGLFLRDVKSLLREQWDIRLARIVGVDLVRSPGDIISELGSHAEFVEQSVDGTALPFADESFDVVFCNHVLEHVFQTEFVVREMRRVLRPDGVCVISVPNLASWVNRVALLFAGQPLGTEVGSESIMYGFWPSLFKRRLAAFHPAGHIRDFTPRALADLCRGAGFRPVGWWNQDERRLLRMTAWSGRAIGIILRK